MEIGMNGGFIFIIQKGLSNVLITWMAELERINLKNYRYGKFRYYRVHVRFGTWDSDKKTCRDASS